jgi:hypothetical protein
MQIRLRQYSFFVSSPFKAGHRLTAEEARALNWTRAEQIKNNMRRHIDSATRELTDGELLPDSSIAKLQARVDLLDQGHQFRQSDAAEEAELGALEVEALRVAEERLPAPAPEGERFELMVRLLASQPEVQEEARLRLQLRSQEANRLLEELL